MHEKFQLIQSRKQFARLLELCEKQENQLAEDPRPFLDEAYKRLSRALRLIDDIKAAASGSDEMLRPYNPNELPRFVSIQESMMNRLQKVQKLIRDAEHAARR